MESGGATSDGGTAAPPIWVDGPDDVIRFANPAAVAGLGYERHDRDHQPLLPSCRSRTTRRRSSSAAVTIRARDAAASGPRLGVRNCGRHELGELSHARLRAGRQRLGLPRPDDQRAKWSSSHLDRAADR
jgi:hypothetical protein